MTRTDRAADLLVVAVAALALLSAVPLGALGTGAATTGGTVAHTDAYNYTVRPVDDPETAQNSDGDETCIPSEEAPTEDEGATGGGENCDPYNGHMPGDENASYAQFSFGGEEATADLAVTDVIIHEDLSGDYDMSGCENLDAGVAGIDRNNDESGYSTNEPLLSHAKNTIEKENIIIVVLYDSDDLGGEPLRLNKDDQIVARVEDCYTNPSQPGWYRWRGYANGTTDNDERAEIELFSHYFYICNCTSRQQAIERLGPPPSQGPEPPTPTPTPGESTDTPTEATTAPGDTATPTDAPAPTPTDSQTTATPTESPTDTPTSSETDRPGQSTPTATPTTSDTLTSTDGPGQTTATATPAGTTQGGTPASGAGPGLGVLAALGGLLGAALLLRRE